MFRRITLPLLMPWLILLSIRDIIASAQSTFAPAYLMTDGGPYYATLFLPLLIFEEAFDRFRFGEASAMMVVMFVGIGLLLYLLRRSTGGWGYADDI
jgi:multiple sugar transport system permease protein